jgi:putative ABC transport system permease protein
VLRLALKMLMQDKVKYAMLISGLTFCALLMTQQASVFCGLMRWTTATVRNVNVPIWVMDAKVQRADDVVPMRSIEVERVKSVAGIDWAVPLFWTVQQTRLEDGSFEAMQLMGLDSSTLIGRPAVMLKGRFEDLRLPNAVVVDQVAVEKFQRKNLPLEIGTTFEINDKEARVVGICYAERSFLGQPYCYTTYDRALEYTPDQRKRLSYVLAAPKPGVSNKEAARRISQLDGIRAIPRDEFYWQTMIWYIKNTGIPISFGTVVVLGALVGIAISGQTFYLFIHENLRYLAAFKAMGARTRTLAGMVLVQSFTVGFVGYGLGVGLASWFGNAVVAKGQPPFYMPWQLLLFTGAVILMVCSTSALIGLRQVLKLEPAVVFR